MQFAFVSVNDVFLIIVVLSLFLSFYFRYDFTLPAVPRMMLKNAFFYIAKPLSSSVGQTLGELRC